MQMANINPLGATVDALGKLQAQIADLEAQAKALKAALAEHGAGAYEGKLFRATVTESERETLDMKAVRKKLSPQFIAAHTKTTPVVTVRVSGKIDGNVDSIIAKVLEAA